MRSSFSPRCGSARLAHRPAKVYRRTFALQPGALAGARPMDEDIPRGLAGTHIVDVTAQYVPVSDVELELGDSPDGRPIASICVYNEGEWRPVHWSRVERGKARFSDMGRRVLYLPAWYSRNGVIPAGDPFILENDGTRRALAPGSGTVELTVASQDAPPMDARAPAVRSPPGDFEILTWERDGWRRVDQRRVEPGSTAIVALPVDGLCLLREIGSRATPRPFTIDGGAIVHW